MSHISPTSQPLYGGSMPSGAVSYASPTVPHEGMSTDKIVLITAGSLITAGLIGFGIYQFTKKDKPHKNQDTGHSSDSPAMKAFVNATKSMNIGDMDRLFNKLNNNEKNEVVLAAIDEVKESNHLYTVKMMVFTFKNGNLTPEMEQAFNRKNQSFALDPSFIDFKGALEKFKLLSDDEKIKDFKKIISNPEVNGPHRFMNQQAKDILKLYYARFVRPNISQTVHEMISNHAANKFYIHLA
jgi:hypothetical protein